MPSIDSPISVAAFQVVRPCCALGRLVVDAQLAKADPAREPLEEAVALGKPAQRRGGARGEQPEVAGVLRNFLPRSPIDQRIEGLHAEPPERGFVLAMRLRGEDDVVAVVEPVADQCLDQVGRMLAVGIHEQHGAAPRDGRGRRAAPPPCRNCATARRPARRARRREARWRWRAIGRGCRRRHRRPRRRDRIAVAACAPLRRANDGAAAGRRPR